MSRIPTPTGENVRLLVVATLAGIAALITMANAAGAPAELVESPPMSSLSVLPSADGAPSDGSTGPLPPAPTEPPSVVVDETNATASAGVAATTEDGQETTTTVVPGGIGVVTVVGDAGSASLGDAPMTSGSVAAACSPIDAPSVVADEPDDGSFYRDSFATADAWDGLSGSWSVVDGVYQQLDASGYDLITQLRVDPPEQYRVSVVLEALGEGLGGGVVLAQPRPSERSGSTVVDFTDGGTFIRWGRYDSTTGQYEYVGGVSMGESFDPEVAHELTVDVRKERTMVMVDGVEAGTFEPLGFGRIGLVTSRSAVAFDDVKIVEVGS
jgi:hypothetical protein